jgi:UDP-MurNAc hydroxylase
VLIRWVNHASFVVEHDDVRLICDPWLSGPAFAGGWDLLAKSVFQIGDFANITHIWYSHEHPDHFVPRVLQEIDEALRPQITVLYQKTRDGKVAKFCRSLGYKVRELTHGERTAIGTHVAVTCDEVPFYDSWLLIEADGTRILNLNDCVVGRETVAESIAKQCGRVDVLLSQFNDAEWKGNPDRKDLREASAREKLRRLKLQATTIKPTHMIPFASFFFFSHEENFYLNDSMNDVGDVARFLASECGTTPLVLYPGDTWKPGDAHDPDVASARYRSDLRAAKPLHAPGESIALEQLARIADRYRNRIKKQNNEMLLWLAANPWLPVLPSIRIYLDDLALAIQFDWRHGLVQKSLSREACDISMHSESLAYVFRFDWGMDTLTVNGRFRANEEGYARFVKTFAPGSLNNIGRRLGFELLADPPFIRRMLAMRS